MPDTDHYTDHDFAIDGHRADLICAMNTALSALDQAAKSVAALMSNRVYDSEFAEGNIGGDVTAFLDDSLRFTRAAYARTREVTDVS
jgi:hypothetical protein